MAQARGAPAPIGERQRLDALHRYDILDSAAEGAFDDLTRLAAQICGTPAAGLSLIDADRQWFKARFGIPASQTPRSVAFSAYVILDPGNVMVVPDLREDPRFASNALVAGAPHLRFYAGAALISSDGEAIGVLSVLDYQPSELNQGQRDALKALARQAVGQLELRLALRDLERKRLEMEVIQTQLTHENATDALTGIANRRAFELRLEAELARRERDGTTLALAMIDVDLFKAYNDGFGHLAGDEALRQIATVLANTLRSYDFVARYGGEEFAVLLPATTPEGGLLHRGTHARGRARVRLAAASRSRSASGWRSAPRCAAIRDRPAPRWWRGRTRPSTGRRRKGAIASARAGPNRPPAAIRFP